jgi:hypothetical protein
MAGARPGSISAGLIGATGLGVARATVVPFSSPIRGSLVTVLRPGVNGCVRGTRVVSGVAEKLPRVEDFAGGDQQAAGWLGRATRRLSTSGHRSKVERVTAGAYSQFAVATEWKTLARQTKAAGGSLEFRRDCYLS